MHILAIIFVLVVKFKYAKIENKGQGIQETQFESMTSVHAFNCS